MLLILSLFPPLKTSHRQPPVMAITVMAYIELIRRALDRLLPLAVVSDTIGSIDWVLMPLRSMP